MAAQAPGCGAMPLPGGCSSRRGCRSLVKLHLGESWRCVAEGEGCSVGGAKAGSWEGGTHTAPGDGESPLGGRSGGAAQTHALPKPHGFATASRRCEGRGEWGGGFIGASLSCHVRREPQTTRSIACLQGVPPSRQLLGLARDPVPALGAGGGRGAILGGAGGPLTLCSCCTRRFLSA